MGAGHHHCDRQRLVDHYLHVTRRWMRLTGPGALCLPPRQGELIDGAVGSDLVLTTPVLIKLFAALRGQVKNDRMLLGTSDGLRHFHNSLTNYVLMMAYWLTGYRAVRDPLGAITEYNRERRLLLIADKTGDGYGHARVVPVCSLLAEQLDLYEKHIQWIRNRLSLANRGCRGVPMFFLDNEFNEVQVRPASMEAMLEWAYVLPLNLNRHWLRGELRRLEVPGPQVDRYMGHWSIGQEPWGRYSGVDPLDFSQALEPALEQLAAMLKLEIVRGVA
ncbi:hypothetical protein [Marinobacter lipolyticus]|uniref:hypothetical protein n=1 Tax=Marinobacter lipolyticus TaxID=209639 RepID=UPI001BCCF7ED|nr:hypothetical protein [Marinobacter lipolyticus]